MLDNRNEKHSDHEESEYHFSDEEVNYEVETDTAKPSVAGAASGVARRMSRSKRMLLSFSVFFVLVYIVYKMVVPSAPSSPPAEITPQETVQQKAAPVASAAPPALTPASVPTPPSTSVTESQPSAPVEPSPGASAAVQSAPSSLANTAPVRTNYVEMNTAAQPAATVPANNPAAAVINQLQADYASKINEVDAKIQEVDTQDKAIHDQVQALDVRIAAMEAQINQLMQMLMHPTQGARNAPVPMASVAQPPVAEPKVPYSVQAIIPGRAWLRSDSGEAVTVAEGDTIKGLGRVTKIDPYDGVVEINTGNRVISLSYGSNG